MTAPDTTPGNGNIKGGLRGEASAAHSARPGVLPGAETTSFEVLCRACGADLRDSGPSIPNGWKRTCPVVGIVSFRGWTLYGVSTRSIDDVLCWSCSAWATQLVEPTWIRILPLGSIFPGAFR